MWKKNKKRNNEIISKYNDRYSTREIAKLLNIPKSTIHYILKSNNIHRSISDSKIKYTLDKNYFKAINTEIKAYFLGLLYADGCNYNKSITLSLEKKDLYLLKLLSKDIKSNRSIYKNNENRVLYLYGEELSNDLSKLGCISKKSLILKYPMKSIINEDLTNHFIRGYFDGDGCIYLNKDKNYYKVSFAGTYDFLSNIQKIINKNIGLNFTKILKQHNIFSLQYSGKNNCLKIKDYLYNNATIFLNRKRDKFDNIVQR